MTNHETGAWHREVITGPTEATLRALQERTTRPRSILRVEPDLPCSSVTACPTIWTSFATAFSTKMSFFRRCNTSKDFRLQQKLPTLSTRRSRRTKVSFLGYSYPLLFPTTSSSTVWPLPIPVTLHV